MCESVFLITEVVEDSSARRRATGLCLYPQTKHYRRVGVDGEDEDTRSKEPQGIA